MALTGFPDVIQVTLDTYFNGTGHGLNNTNVIQLYRNGDSWYEKDAGGGVGDTTAASDNRIKISFTNSIYTQSSFDFYHQGKLYLLNSPSTAFYSENQYAGWWADNFTVGQNYTFLSIWSGTGLDKEIMKTTWDDGSFAPTGNDRFKMFSTMEAYEEVSSSSSDGPIPQLADKTAYVFV